MDIFESNAVNLFKLPIKGRNDAIDAVFYDVTSLSRQELLALTPMVDRKGTIIVVSPRDSQRADKIRHYPNSLQFLIEEGDSVEAIAVAGVGSSVLGTAALARNVADHYQIDVAGIVTGYGVADVVLEGLGGWFFYGKIDQFRYELEKFVGELGHTLPTTSTPGGDGRDRLTYFDTPLDAYVPSNPDVSALHDILFARYLHTFRTTKLRLLVGHSKGNLLISFVLNHMNHELSGMTEGKGIPPHDPFENLAVVTFGAVVDITDELIKSENKHQFLGRLDLLGYFNSRSYAGMIEQPTWVEGAGHHLNTRIPCCMRVSNVLKDVELPDFPPDKDKRDYLIRRKRSQPSAARSRSLMPVLYA